MKPLLKSHRIVDWHIPMTDGSTATDNLAATEFLNKLSTFLAEHKVQRKCTDKKERSRLRVRKKKPGEKVKEGVSVKDKDSDNSGNVKEQKKQRVSLTKDWPVCLGLRSVLRALDKDDHLTMAIIDADALKPPAVSQFLGLFAASCKVPVYAVHKLSERLAKQLKLKNVHAIGFLKQDKCESMVLTTAELLTPVSVADADTTTDGKKQTPSDTKKRKFTPANIVTPGPSTKKRKRQKRKKGVKE